MGRVEDLLTEMVDYYSQRAARQAVRDLRKELKRVLRRMRAMRRAIDELARGVAHFPAGRPTTAVAAKVRLSAPDVIGTLRRQFDTESSRAGEADSRRQRDSQLVGARRETTVRREHGKALGRQVDKPAGGRCRLRAKAPSSDSHRSPQGPPDKIRPDPGRAGRTPFRLQGLGCFLGDGRNRAWAEEPEGPGTSRCHDSRGGGQTTETDRRPKDGLAT